MIKFINKYKQVFTIVGALSVLTVCYFQQKQNAKLKIDINTKQTIIDSLNNEMFVKQIEVGSYEVMWGILEEINRPLADSISNQVE